MRSRFFVPALVLCGAMAVSAARGAPVSRDDFQAETTGNLVSLCGASEADPLYTAAQNFCHGFAVGTYRTIMVQQMASQTKRKLFCVPDNPPTRDQAIASFVQWASTRPTTLARPPVDGIVEFLVSQYPCS